MVKIFIDPGHGGTDPGAQANGLQEKNVTLQIASRIRDILISEYENVTVLMSRNGDQTVSLNSRTNAANNWGADFYLSVHINSGGGTGFESYIYRGVGRPTLTYQEFIHNKVLEQVPLKNRGIKQADFHVLRESRMDALLTESGFIDHAEDAERLKNPGFLASLARGHALGIAACYRLPKKTVNPIPQPSRPSTPNSNDLFKVQIGAYKDKVNADQMVSKANAKGFQTYVKQENNLYKVQIGAYRDRENAEELLNRAKAAGFEAVILIE